MPTKLLILCLCIYQVGCSRSGKNEKLVKEEEPLWRENIGQSAPSSKLRRAAEQGDPEKQFELGTKYFKLAESKFHSQHVKADNKNPSKDEIKNHKKLWIEIYGRAEEWFLKSAEQDYVPAQFQLVKLYTSSTRTGLLADSNMDKAISDRMQADWQKNKDQRLANLANATKWCRRAAESGYAPAQYELGKILCGASISTKGSNTRVSEGEAKEGYQWYRKAAGQGYAPAAYQMAMLYNSDKRIGLNKVLGIETDDTKCLTWLLTGRSLHLRNKANSASAYDDVIKVIKRKLSASQIQTAEKESQKTLMSIGDSN